MDFWESRRSFLLAIAGTTVGLTGCSALGTDAGESFQIGSIEIRNNDTANHRLRLFVERDSEVVYWNDLSVDAKQANTLGGQIIAPESLARTEGDYVIHARLDTQSNIATFDSSARNLTGCHVVMVRIESDGSLSFAVTGDAYECDPEYTAPMDS